MTRTTRLRQARLLVRPLWRSGAWTLVPAAVAGVLAFVVALRLGGVRVPAPAAGFAAMLLMAAAAAYGFEDVTADVVAPAPAPRMFRMGLRATGTWVVVGACWATLLGYFVATATPVEYARPTLMLAVLVAVSSLAGLTWGGAAGGPALVVFVVAAARLPDRWAVIDPTPGSGQRLGAILALLLVAFAVQCRDPAYRRRR